jgi:hypothetical protein
MRAEKEITDRRDDLLKVYNELYFKRGPTPEMLSLERAVMSLNWVLGGEEDITDEQKFGN